MRCLRLILVMFLVLVGIAGCARHRPPPGPPEVKVIPPKPGEEAARVPPEGSFTVEEAESIRRIHHQMMNEAQEHLAREELNKAIQDLQRLLALRPDQELETEGRWMLAQAYRKTGQWEGARDQYRVLASAPGRTPYQGEAERNFQELDGLLEQARMPPQDTQAVRLRLEQIPDSGGFDEGIKRMREDGVTTLLIDLECRDLSNSSKGKAIGRSVEHIDELHTLLRSFVSRSHLQNLRVFAGIEPRCAGNWKNPAPADWKDRTYDKKHKTVRENRFFDLFHPEYQHFLLDFFTRIAADGVDGIIFLEDYPLGPYDGISPSALEAFQKVFQVRFMPSEAFEPSIDPWQLTKPSLASDSPKMNLLWRWTGWKARERLSVLEKVFHHLRRQFLTLQVGLEIHPHGLTDPVRALVEYSEDAMEATVRPFSFFYVRPEIDRQAAFEQKEAIEKLRRISTKAILARLLPVVDNPRRVWVSFPADGRKRISQGTEMESSILNEFPSGIGVVHDLRAFS